MKKKELILANFLR